MKMTIQQSFEYFTESGYRTFLKRASQTYQWEFFGTSESDRHIILRHDVDLSPHRALALAKIEHEEGVKSTFLFMLHSDFYNLLEQPIVDIVRNISKLGHQIGLHFDYSFYDHINANFSIEEKLNVEMNIIKEFCDVECNVFSFHNPDTNASLTFRSDEIGGMLNAYSEKLQKNYKYISDSNGYWRFDNLFDAIESEMHKKLHVLIHPEWWTPDAMSPRQRVERAVRGRGGRVLESYDDLLRKWNRNNVS